VTARRTWLTSKTRSPLEDEIAATRHAYVVSAVTEIAVLRADLSGALEG